MSPRPKSRDQPGESAADILQSCVCLGRFVPAFGYSLCLPPSRGSPTRSTSKRARHCEKRLPDSLIVIFGATEQENGEIRTGFFQRSDFYYLTGWTEPNAILVLTPSAKRC